MDVCFLPWQKLLLFNCEIRSSINRETAIWSGHCGSLFYGILHAGPGEVREEPV